MTPSQPEMRKIAPKVILAGWCLWVLQRIVVLVGDPVWHSGGSSFIFGSVFGAVMVPAIGAWLAWRLHMRPSRGVALWFVAICLLSLWKFCFAEILLRIYPSSAGHTLGWAVQDWWASHASSVTHAITKFGSLTLVVFSMVYTIPLCRRPDVKPPPLPAGSGGK